MVLAELLSCHLLVDIPLDTWGLLLFPYSPARNLEGSRGGLVCHGARAGVAARVELLPQLLSSLLPLGREPGQHSWPVSSASWTPRSVSAAPGCPGVAHLTEVWRLPAEPDGSEAARASCPVQAARGKVPWFGLASSQMRHLLSL